MPKTHLVQLLIPVFDAAGNRFSEVLHSRTKTELTERFGGLTRHSRAPAEGLWKPAGRKTVRDDIVVYEVMCARLDRIWWKHYRRQLEKRFHQRELVIRAQPVTPL